MNLFRHFQERIAAEIRSLIGEGALPAGLDVDRIGVEPPRDGAHGDIACNAAMMLASAAGRRPRELAVLLAQRLLHIDGVATVEVAGPGFLNLRLKDGFWHARLLEILAAGTAYGDSRLGAGQPVNVEYVSANPTGPLHVGHGRGAVVGDALAALLEKAGFRVTREYYVNDAGGQVDALAHSLRLRYLIAAGAEPPEMFEQRRARGEVQYGGDYLLPMAETLFERDGSTLDRCTGSGVAADLPQLRRGANARRDPRRSGGAWASSSRSRARNGRWSSSVAWMRRFACSTSAD